MPSDRNARSSPDTSAPNNATGPPLREPWAMASAGPSALPRTVTGHVVGGDPAGRAVVGEVVSPRRSSLRVSVTRAMSTIIRAAAGIHAA